MTNDVMTQDKERLLEKKARFFFNSQLPVHVTLKRRDRVTGGKIWERGTILHEPGTDCFILSYFPEGQKQHNGRHSDPYFYLEIEEIEEFVKKEVTA